MKNRLTYILAALLSVFALTVACTDLSEIEDRIDTLESRVEALETVCKALNSNIEALEEFHAANKSISSVVEKDGVYTLTLSDGSIITLSQGSVGEAVMPFITIDAKGYWTVNGKQLTVGGQPVPATGQNGATPIFGVDANGYWTVKYSQDGTAEQVKDMNGNPVKATIAGSTSEPTDSFFSDVKVEADKVTITLKADGKTYSLPIIPDFFCAIKGAENQPVIFDPGDTKSFTVEQKNVASATLFTPKGWNASLENNLLSITAPAGVVTKASADTRQDVAILAISETGFASISKVKVQLSDKPIVVVPTAAITAGTATQNSLSFEVVLANVAEWYYMLQKSDAEAPDAAALKAATKGNETSLTLTQDAGGAELTASTSYTLYVLPVNATAEGGIASQAAATTEKVYNSLYEKYNDGGDIVIGEKTINKATFGEAALISKDAPAIASGATAKVFFVEPDANAIFTYTDAIQTMIIIGNKTDRRSGLTFQNQLKLNKWTANDMLIISGINIDASGAGNYLLVQNLDGAYEYLHLNDCHILTASGKTLTYVSTSARSYKNFIMTNCDYPVISKNNFVISLSSSTATYPNIKFENNVFYNNTAAVIEDFRLFVGNKASIGSLVINNNTFINLHTSTASGSAYGAVYVDALTSMECSKNLIFTNLTMVKHAMLLRATDKKYPADGSKIKDNIVYKADNGSFNWQVCFEGAKTIPGSEDTKVITVNPFEGGTFDIASYTFKPVADYAAYGAQR